MLSVGGSQYRPWQKSWDSLLVVAKCVTKPSGQLPFFENGSEVAPWRKDAEKKAGIHVVGKEGGCYQIQRHVDSVNLPLVLT